MVGEHIGPLIRQLRKGAGMSQMKLAEKMGVSYQQVQKYEKGVSKLNVPRLLQVSDIFGVHPTVFIGEQKKAAEGHIPYQGLTEDEGKLLMLFRRLKRKRLKEGFVEMMRDIVKLSESAD